jgi:hypothetical protein
MQNDIAECCLGLDTRYSSSVLVLLLFYRQGNKSGLALGLFKERFQELYSLSLGVNRFRLTDRPAVVGAVQERDLTKVEV